MKQTKCLGLFCPRMLMLLLIALCTVMAKADPKLPDTRIRTMQQVDIIEISGRVTDSNDEPIVGVAVIVQGTPSLGTITDINGNYTLKAPADATIEFNFIGFKTQVVAVDGRTSISVTLEDEASELDEIIVTGYSSQRKASIIGAIETIKPTELHFGSNRSVSSNLAGKLSGVIAVQRSGEPGYDNSNFWIRGISSFAGSTTPLVLVDGVERDLNRVDVNEIESFSVLKDASASAMYGVRGANGVIIITTKHGQVGPAQVNVHAEYAITSPVQLPEFLDAPNYMELLNETAKLDGVGSVPFTQEQIDRTRSGYDPDIYPNVDWLDEILRDYAHTGRVSLDISGGSDYIRYSAVASYFGETGLLERDKTLPINNGTHNRQFNLRSNTDINVTKTTLVRVNIGGYLQRFMKQRCNTDDVFRYAFMTLPFAYPARFTNGDYGRIMGRHNPWEESTQHGYDFTTASQIQTLFSVEQDLKFLTEGLKIKGTFSFDRYNSSRRSRTSNPTLYTIPNGRDEEGNLLNNIFEPGDESMGEDYGTEYGESNVYFEADLLYNRRFGRHDVDAMFLYNQSSSDRQSYQEYRKQGIAGRLSYTFDNRYVGEFNFGYNGSENFDKGHRFGFFPSFALGWLLSEEKFFEPAKELFHKIKFRGSIGQVGNDNIGGRRFAFLSTVYTGQAGYTWGETRNRGYSGITEGEVGVSDLTWETVTKSNLGLELGIANIVDLTVDLFQDKRKDIFMQRKVIPAQTGFTAKPWANYGKMTNKGFEISLNIKKHWENGLSTELYGNYTYAKNTVDEFDEPEDRKGTYRSQTGRSYNELWGLTAERLFTYDDFNDDGTLKAGIPEQNVGATQLYPGDIKFVDRNGDGVIDGEDEGYIGGQYDPRIVYGFGGSVAFKGFDFNFFFQGVADTYRIIGGGVDNPFFIPCGGTTTEGNAYSKNLSDRWTDENQDPYAFWPRLHYGPNLNNVRASSWWKKDMSFLRCKTLELGYSLPKRVIEKIGSKGCRVYVSGNNLFCFTDFELWDPEINTDNGSKYPINRSVLFGIDINF